MALALAGRMSLLEQQQETKEEVCVVARTLVGFPNLFE
jgi:hypothetical protein